MQIYRIGVAKGAQRIGYARDPAAVLKPIQAASPEDVVMKTWKVTTGQAMLADKLIRLKLEHLTKGDGWYAGPVATIDKAICAAIGSVVKVHVPEVSPADYAETMQRLRTNVFETTQDMIAVIAGRSPGIISRWEAGTSTPGIPELLRLRNYALAIGLPWQDSFLLGTPAAPLPTSKDAN